MNGLTTSQIEKFPELVSLAKAAMLVTRQEDGSPRARPIQLVEATEAGSMKFVASMHSGKVEEIRHDPHVCVTVRHSGTLLSVTGNAVVEQDRKELKRLWKHVNDAGFEGPNDPSVALVTVQATFCRVLAESAA